MADYLWEFIFRHARNDFSWTAPNRRFLSQGLCLPGMQSEELGTVICRVDGSGSCWDPKIVVRFVQLLQGVLETFDCELTIIYHDIPVHAVETWKSSDGPLADSQGCSVGPVISPPSSTSTTITLTRHASSP